MALPEEVISEIKFKNDIETVISPYVNLKRRGKNLVGLCPFHNEKTPSFTVYPENGSFYCFGCGVGGDIFTFTKLIENLDYIEAVKLLAERSGVVLPQDGSYDDSIPRLKKIILEINRETARFYHKYLMSEGGKWALDYLVGRGLTVSTIKHFGLGCAPNDWDKLTRHLKSLGYSENDMFQANVVAKSSKGTYYDRFRNRVMFPIIDLRGNVIAFSGRANPSDDKAAGKYVNTSDTLVYKKSQNLFGFNFAKNNCDKNVILVEGNMDVVSLHQAGFENAVAALGTAFTVEQAKLLSRYTKEIILNFDSDSAGQKALSRALLTLKDSGLNVRIMSVPDGKDPDEFLKKNSPEAFGKLLDNAKGNMEYQLLTAANGVDMISDMGKLEYLRRVSEILASTDDKITVDYYVSKLSSEFNIAKTTLYDRIEKIKSGLKKEQQKKEINEVLHPKYSYSDINPEKRLHKRAAAAEETVISLLLKHPDLLKKTEGKLNEDDFVTSFGKRLFSDVKNIIESGDNIDISSFSDRLTPAELGFTVTLFNRDFGGDTADKLMDDCIRIILEEHSKTILSENRDLDDGDWEAEMNNIIKNKKGE